MAKQSNTWGHFCAWVDMDGAPANMRRCSVPHCQGSAEYITRYEYVTGRAGRVTDAIRYACDEHAVKFCDKHNIAIETVPAITWSSIHRQVNNLIAWGGRGGFPRQTDDKGADNG